MVLESNNFLKNDLLKILLYSLFLKSWMTWNSLCRPKFALNSGLPLPRFMFKDLFFILFVCICVDVVWMYATYYLSACGDRQMVLGSLELELYTDNCKVPVWVIGTKLGPLDIKYP